MRRNAPTAEPRLAPAVKARARLALLWLILALVWQGFATQTHAHASIWGDQPATASTRAVAAAPEGGTPAPACPLCEEKALFGAYLASGPIAFTAPLPVAYEHAAATLPALALTLSSHGWQSRAPPIFTT